MLNYTATCAVIYTVSYKSTVKLDSNLCCDWKQTIIIIIIQNLYNAQIQASSSQRRWCSTSGSQPVMNA